MIEIRQKVMAITGCNRGLGHGIAQQFLYEGHQVYGINRTKMDSGLQESTDYHEILADVSSRDLASQVAELLPDRIDTLVLNAGIRRFGTAMDLSEQDWEDSINTNLNAVFYYIKALLPKVKQAKGDIIIIGSHAEKYTFEKGMAYCTTKGGLKELSECLMQEVRYDDVRVSYLSLGSIKNREHGGDESWKLTPLEVGKTVYGLVSLPKNVLIPYVDIRPAKPLKDSKEGIERLQYV